MKSMLQGAGSIRPMASNITHSYSWAIPNNPHALRMLFDSFTLLTVFIPSET